MTIPFLDIFKKVTGRFLQNQPTTPTQSVQRIRFEKPSDQKLSKTVLPHTTRSSNASGPDPFKAASITDSNKIAFGAVPASGPMQRELPPAIVLALQPKTERAISLELSDFLDEMPLGY